MRSLAYALLIGTAGAVLAARLREHTEALHGGIQSLVLDGDAAGSAVHGLRKTIRRPITSQDLATRGEMAVVG